MTPCAIIDIDGTIADLTHRLHFIQGEKRKDWESFLDAMKDDVVFPYMQKLCQYLFSSGLPIVLCTGRSESRRVITENWLDRVSIKYYRLIMRGEGDRRKDYVVKKEMLVWLRQLGFHVLFAIEDRPTVVAMWRENDVPCLVPDDSTWHQ